MGLILNYKTICDVSAQLRKQGKIIIFTHGAFDIHHIGQAEFLRQSKKLGDVLILAIDSDSRIAYYKNASRPIIDLKHRTLLFEHSAHVDLIFPLDYSDEVSESFYMDLYKKVNPHIITYGRLFGAKDFLSKKTPKLKQCKFVEINHEYDNALSTTKIIERSKKA